MEKVRALTPTTQKKVVIVEDNELNLKLFKDLLDHENIEIQATRDGQGAIDFIAEYMPDLVIMDIQLPNISGIDLIKTLKSSVELSDIPIVAVTAFAMQDDKDRILEAGCEKYLSKPISINSFVGAVEQYIG